MQAVLRKTVIIAALLALWEIGVRVSHVSPLIVPPVEAVLQSLFAGILDGSLLLSTWATVNNLIIAMVIGISIAVALNVLAFVSGWAREFLQTLSAALNPLPAIALLPVAFLWFGATRTSLLFVLVNAVVWAMALNIFTGFSTVPQTIRYVGRNMGLRGLRLFRYVYVPAALPYIYTGVKISWAFGWRTVIAAELVFGATASTTGGLGWRLLVDRYNLDSAGTFAGLLMIVIIGLAAEAAFGAVERATIQKWGMAERHAT
ncbi:MAG TPA: ABC transporter permease [Candidatus Acidoferrales bacterium]|nr:ABC transporter permease [Candidatus Acidoferrales bacterium]